MYLCEKINSYIMLQVQRICKEKGLTMQEVASRLGITYQSLYDSIKGNPTLKRLQDIANALNVEVSELFESSKPQITCPHCGKPLNIEIN